MIIIPYGPRILPACIAGEGKGLIAGRMRGP
jgi:hypothetical protein